MSATYPIRKTAAPVRKAVAKPRPRLVVITNNRQVVARGPFIALVGALLLAGLLSLLMLHMLAAQDAFRQTTLQQRLTALTDTEQKLEQQVQIDSAPAALEARAKALGMVPSTITSYHQRPDGRTVANEVPMTQVVTAPTTSTTNTATTNPTTATANPTTAPATSKHGKTKHSNPRHVAGTTQ